MLTTNTLRLCRVSSRTVIRKAVTPALRDPVLGAERLEADGAPVDCRRRLRVRRMTCCGAVLFREDFHVRAVARSGGEACVTRHERHRERLGQGYEGGVVGREIVA